MTVTIRQSGHEITLEVPGNDWEGVFVRWQQKQGLTEPEADKARWPGVRARAEKRAKEWKHAD